MGHSNLDPIDTGPAWNIGRKLGAKRPLKPKEIWAVRFMLDQNRKVRDRALFDLAIDSKLRGCDLVKIKIGDLVSGGRVRNRAMVIQQKPNGRCSSSYLNRRGHRSSPGSSGEAADWRNLLSRAASIDPIISVRGNMLDWSMSG
jgi:hypothetical protein